jgi:hypothetical protein
MGNDQTIYFVNQKRCKAGKAHNIYARKDVVEQLEDNQVEYNTNFSWANLEHRNAFHKAGLTLDMFEDSHECAEYHVSLIHCDDCKEILAVATHCY